MFKPKNPTAPSTNSNGQAKADAFLNLVLVAADGSEHSVRSGSPLHKTNLLERSIINKHLAAAEKGQTVEFTLKGTVRMVVDVENADDIEL